ncbi:MAG TPA: hypothetical protein VN026_04470 [Bacteroidia bacterium]|nr:hypothetical protein [Bacteroidia bacterium]
MKHLITLLFAMIFCGINAQSYPWLKNFYNEFPARGDLFDSTVAANHYHDMTRTLTKYTKKGTPKKRTDTFAFTYDDKGFLITLFKSNSKNKKSEKSEYTYKDSLPINYNYYKNNKLVRRYEITRNDKKKIIDLVKKNSKGEVILKQHNEFDDNINRLTRIVIYDKNNKEKNAIEYSYYDGKNMKQAKEYKNGKLKKVWNYTCDPVGTNEKKVKEIKVCKNVNADENGNRVESNRIVNPKGEVELRVNTFDKNDKMIKQMVYDDIKHKLKSEYTYTIKAETEELERRFYSRKGKEYYYNKVVYSKSNKILSREVVHRGNQKNKYKTIFTYNDKDLLTRSETFDNKNRKISENIHTFN